MPTTFATSLYLNLLLLPKDGFTASSSDFDVRQLQAELAAAFFKWLAQQCLYDSQSGNVSMWNF